MTINFPEWLDIFFEAVGVVVVFGVLASVLIPDHKLNFLRRLCRWWGCSKKKQRVHVWVMTFGPDEPIPKKDQQ